MIVPVLCAAAHYKRDIPLEIAKMKINIHISHFQLYNLLVRIHMVELCSEKNT